MVRKLFWAGMLLPLSIASAAHAQQQSYITDFNKNNNIYTNLNQQFPNTGPGVPGSTVGQPNSSFIFNPATYTSPNYVPGSNLANNGITFDITSDPAGRDFAEASVPIFASTALSNVSSFHALVAAYNGSTVNFSFTSSQGVLSYNNIFVPDFNGGGPINQMLGQALVQTVFQVTDVGAGGTGNSSNGAFNTYDLTEISINFNQPLAAFSGFTFTDNGYRGLLLGATAVTGPTSPVGAPAPLAGAGLLSFFGAGGIAMRKRAKRMIGSLLLRRLAAA